MDITSASLNNIIDAGFKLAMATNSFKTTLGALDIRFESGYLELFIRYRFEDVKHIVTDCPDLKPLLYTIQDNDSSSAISDDYRKLMVKEGQLLNRVPEHIKKDINWLILMSCYLSLEEDTRDTAVKMLEEILEILVINGMMNGASIWILASALWISDYPTYREEVLSRYNAEEHALRESHVNSQSSNTSSKTRFAAMDAYDKVPELESKSGGCYIATAVYGSYDCPEVWTLRRYRDYKLAKTFWGRIFIRIYYAVSPVIVRLVGDTKWFNKIWRNELDKMIKLLMEEGYDSTPYEDSDW